MFHTATIYIHWPEFGKSNHIANLAAREAGNYRFYFGQPFALLKFKNSTAEEVENNIKGYLNICAPRAK